MEIQWNSISILLFDTLTKFIEISSFDYTSFQLSSASFIYIISESNS